MISEFIETSTNYWLSTLNLEQQYLAVIKGLLLFNLKKLPKI